MTSDGWIQLALFVACLAGQGVIQFVAMNRKLTQLCERLQAVKDRCVERGEHHTHHFSVLERHEVLLENHGVRLTQLEKATE